MTKRCPQCGEENPDRFRLCGFCGTPLARATATEIRKTVSIVFCDLKGSTELGERLDSEALREVLSRYFEIMRGVLEHHGGTVEKYIGDAIMAVFGLPRLHEDDALRAVRAAAEMRTALATLNEEIERRWGVRLRNRTGVNTGEVVAGDISLGQRLVTGDTVNVAARLEQAAPESEVLIADTTYRLVREAVRVEDVEPLAVKGKSEPLRAFRLLSVRDGPWFSRRLEAPLVGRETELAALESAFEEARRDGRLSVATVLGEAGFGKTRLLEEFVARTGSAALVVRGRCLSYGVGMTFWPIAEIVRQVAGINDRDHRDDAREKLIAALGTRSDEVVDRLFAAIGLDTAQYPLQETFWAVRKLVEMLAARQPLVMIIDDVHWAEQTLLDLVEHLADMPMHAPALVICGARHGLFDDHKTWMADRPNAVRIDLGPLPRDASARIMENLLGRARLPDALRERVLALADGIPLYVEQILSMLIDDGVLRRTDDGTWVAEVDVSSLVVPPTVSALLAARLDRLHVEERTVLEIGSVAGVRFHERAVQELAPEEIRDRVPVDTMLLVEKQLIHPDHSGSGHRWFRFNHVLVRDAAYHHLLKRTRAELHERFAAFLERAPAFDFGELVGYHLEQASRYLSELGPQDAHGAELARRASERLASAGASAAARGDMPAATGLIERAMALREERDPVRLQLAVDLAEGVRAMGQFDKARQLVTRALEICGPDGDPRLVASLRLTELLLQRSTRPDWADVALTEIGGAITVFERAQDHGGLVRAWRLLATLHGTACQYQRAEEAAQHALENARRAGDVAQQRRSLPALALCALFGPAFVDDAIARCERMAEEADGDRRARSNILVVLSQLLAMRGEFQRARDLCRQARAVLEDLGGTVYSAGASLYAARIELLAGDPAAAESVLRPDYEALTRLGERGFLPTAAALLAQATFELGRYEEAEAFTAISATTASASDVESQYRWRCTQARLHARRGDPARGVALAREALRLVLATDGPGLQADVFATLAEVLAAGGDVSAADEARARAVALYRQKGDSVSASAASEAITVTSAVLDA